MSTPSERLLTPEEAASRLAVSPKTLRDWLRSSKVKGFKVGGLWRIPESQVEALLTPDEVADRLSVSPKTVRNWLRDGRLKGSRAGKFWRIRESDLQTFLHASEEGGESA